MSNPVGVSLSFDPDLEVLSLIGVPALTLRLPLLATFLRKNSAVVQDGGRVDIPTTAEILAARYQVLTTILGRLGVALSPVESVTDVLARVQEEERRFADFSAAAAEIWNRQLDTEDFQHFVEVVASRCPGRQFYRKQLFSAFHLAFSQNACNFSVPGAGKTSVLYAAYAYLNSLPENDPRHVNRLLVVGPLSSFKAWEDEYKGIFEVSPTSRRVTGGLSAQAKSDLLRGVSFGSDDIEILLTSYQTLASSEEDFRNFLQRPGRKTMMVLDEAHNIKRADGYWANAALRLSPLANARVVLTGTPAPNGYEDLSNLYKFIYPTRNVIGFPLASLKAMSDGSLVSGIEELKSRVRPYYTRIRKSDLGLPSVTEQTVDVPMQSKHLRIYQSLERRILSAFRVEIDESDAPVRLKARLIRLRQAAVNPDLLKYPLEEEVLFADDGSGFTSSELEVSELIEGFDVRRDLARLEVVRNLAQSILDSQGKVLIWSYFLRNLDLLKEAMSEMAEFVEILSGATPVGTDESEEFASLGTRESIIDRFHVTGQPAILIANPQAVGESISLHKACRSAIYFDRDFNAGRFIQSKDRVHRYSPNPGQEVNYYYLSSQNTVDEQIHGRLRAKEQRLLDLVDSEEIPLFTADRGDSASDIRAILEAYEDRAKR